MTTPTDYTPRAQQVLALARKEAASLNHSYVGTEHILLGILRLGQGPAAEALTSLGVDLAIVRQRVEAQISGDVETVAPAVDALSEAARALRAAADLIERLGKGGGA